VGAEVRFIAQAQVGKPVTTVSAPEGYRLWSAGYDDDPNPVTALEQRLLGARITIDPGSTVLDLATGTGRWLAYAISRGARGIGFDISEEMLTVAARNAGARGRLAAADICRLPIQDCAADLSICSFALGYIAPLENAFREMARVAHRVIVTDVHPDAIEAGWNRSFRIGHRRYNIAHHHHSLHSINACARAAGLTPDWTMEARFGEPEGVIFARAGRTKTFAAAQEVTAVLISAWVHL
jgi:SAM-dependent methyltransferase